MTIGAAVVAITGVIANIPNIFAGLSAVTTKVLTPVEPNIKTEYLVDTSISDESTRQAIARQLGAVVGQESKDDAISLRSFGGNCGAEQDNTDRLIDFGRGNGGQVTQAIVHAKVGRQATLFRGFTEAVSDFDRALQLPARRDTRIIVITSHGRDACDDDEQFVETEIANRVESGHLHIRDIRFVAYQAAAEELAATQRLAKAVGAPAPYEARNEAELRKGITRVALLEPIQGDVNEIIGALDPAVRAVNQAVDAIARDDFGDASKELADANSLIQNSDAIFADLQSRTTDPTFHQIYGLALVMRTQQHEVIRTAADFISAAEKGVNDAVLQSKLSAYQQAAASYDDNVQKMRDLLLRLGSIPSS